MLIFFTRPRQKHNRKCQAKKPKHTFSATHFRLFCDFCVHLRRENFCLMKHNDILLALALSCLCLAAHAKSAPSLAGADFYNRWVILSSEELMDKGRHCLNIPEKRDSAFMWFSIVANRYNQDHPDANDTICVGAMNNLGYMYFFYYQDYYKSYSCLQRGLDIALKNGYSTNLPYLYLNLGNIYNMGDDLTANSLLQTKALDYYKKSFDAAIKTRNYSILCIVTSNMLSTAYNINQMGSISRQIATFQKIKVPKNTPLLEFCRYEIKIYQLIDSRRYNEALAMCDKAATTANDPNTPERFYLSILGMKAHILSLTGDNPSAIALLGKMEQIAHEKEMPDFLVNVYREYSLYYKDIGQAQLSQRYRVMYLELKDSLMTESQLKRVNDMQFMDEISAINDQMAKAKRQKEQQTALLWVVAAVAMAVVAMLAVVVVAYRRQRRVNRILYEKSLQSLQREASERALRHKLQEQLQLNATTEEKKTQHTQRRTLDENTSAAVMHKIEEKMEDVEVIVNPDFNLKRLAELVGEKYWTVSQVINDNYGKNFNALLGEYRVNEACRRINDTANYGHYTIEGIATSVGFKSRSNFVTVFKSITGLTPSEYQRAARTA